MSKQRSTFEQELTRRNKQLIVALISSPAGCFENEKKHKFSLNKFKECPTLNKLPSGKTSALLQKNKYF